MIVHQALRALLVNKKLAEKKWFG